MTLNESSGSKALSLLLPFLLLGSQAGCATRAPAPSVPPSASTPAPAASELQRLQGTWEGAAVGDTTDDKITITITGDSLHFHRDANFWFKTTIALPAGTGPRELHATIKDSAPPPDSIGKVVVAIFKIEDGKLTLAVVGEGTDETRKNFEAAEAEGWARYELRKVRPQKKNTEPPETKVGRDTRA